MPEPSEAEEFKVLDEVQEQQDVNTKSEIDAVLAGRAADMTLESRQMAYELARKLDPGPPRGSWRHTQFVLMGLCICLCSGEGAFGGTVISSINSMDAYLNYFHLSGLATSGTGLIFGIETVGNVASFFPSAYLPDRIGRIKTIFISNIIVIAAGIMNGFSKDLPMLLGGRFVLGVASATAYSASKPLLAELTTPIERGQWVGLLNTFFYVGSILATAVTIPLGNMKGDYCWRIPFFLQVVPALVNSMFILFIPESPRWLYSRGQKEKACDILARLHSKDQDINSPLVQLEIQEIIECIREDGADKRFWDFRGLFRPRKDRYRFGLCCIVSVWGQLSGNGLITYYLPALLAQAGITNGNRQRQLNLVNALTSFIGAMIGSFTIDYLGRRFLMLFASTACMSGMGIVAGLLSPVGKQSSSRANAGISFIFLFMAFFSYGWTPIQAVYPTEVLSFENRAKGLALQNWVANVGSLINTFGLPVALEKITWKTYLIFMTFDLLGLVVIYFWAVETKRLSLEDLDDVFESSSPRKTSLALVKDTRIMANAQREETTQGV